VTVHGGAVELIAPATGGLTAIITLPAARDEEFDRATVAAPLTRSTEPTFTKT
jgi:hypothetical protein